MPGATLALYKYDLVFIVALEGRYWYCHSHLLHEIPEDLKVGDSMDRSHSEPSVPSPVLFTVKLCCPRG